MVFMEWDYMGRIALLVKVLVQMSTCKRREVGRKHIHLGLTNLLDADAKVLALTCACLFEFPLTNFAQ